MRTDRPTSRIITKRFFDALNILIDEKKVTMTSFCEEGKFSRPKYALLKTKLADSSVNDTHNYMYVDIDALSFICDKYGVSPSWLLLGRGSMFGIL